MVCGHRFVVVVAVAFIDHRVAVVCGRHCRNPIGYRLMERRVC